MAHSKAFSFTMEENVKRGMREVCDEIGISMAAAFNIYAKKVARERRIPFDLNVDPFYSERLTNGV